MIKISPDPKHPLGGFAEFIISGINPVDQPIEISVFNSYQEKWLGPSGWQPNRHIFSARNVSWANNNLTLIVGPEIVNGMDEDIPIQILVNETKFETYWPNNINHGPDNAIIGDIGRSGQPERPKATQVTIKSSTDEEPETIAQLSGSDAHTNDDLNEKLEPDNTQVDTKMIDGVQKKNTSLIIMLFVAALVLIVAITAGIWYFLYMYEQNENPLPPSQTNESLSECSQENLNHTLAAQGFAALSEQFKVCRQTISAENALGLLERAMSEKDPHALLTFGMLYDQTVFDDVLEKQIGLTFADQPPLSAEYYARALNAGSTDAQTYLTAICHRLQLMDDTLSRSAVEDYCSEN